MSGPSRSTARPILCPTHQGSRRRAFPFERKHFRVLRKRVSAQHSSIAPFEVHEVRLPQRGDEIAEFDRPVVYGMWGCFIGRNIIGTF